ncbi:MAG: ATP-binding cassette domain-containing protein [Paracoccus sp. (in: a-proteobacteria)]|nr:ATP-binding cassette domain-containing protein [Paracoccus sp. (in: a-proteobacteria)]
MSPAPAISFRDVSVIFGDRPREALPLADEGLSREDIRAETGQILGVHGCDLDVGAGEIVVLMGLSGSGKSTLLRCVNGLNKPVRGSVLVEAGGRRIDAASASARDLRRLRLDHVSMVFQQFGLLPWRSVRDNVGLGLEMAGMGAGARRARIDAQLEAVGLDGWAERPVGDLSGGMQQRVGLARAFATEAPILLMDEPFSALDPLIRTRLQDQLLDLQKRARRTILFVSHDLNEAFRLGSRIALMEGGRIVQAGTAQEIMAAPATDYVADFVAHMNPIAVLRVGDLAEPGAAPDGTPGGTPLAPELPLREALSRLGAAEFLPVEGGLRLSRRAVLDRLAASR